MPASSEFHPSLNSSNLAFAMGLRSNSHRAGPQPRSRVDAAFAPRARRTGALPPAVSFAASSVSPAEPRRVRDASPPRGAALPSMPLPQAGAAGPVLLADREPAPARPQQAMRREPARSGRPAPAPGSAPAPAPAPAPAAAPARRPPGPDSRPRIDREHGFAGCVPEARVGKKKTLRNILYLPVRAVNVALSAVLSGITGGWADPLHTHACARLSESIESFCAIGRRRSTPDACFRRDKAGKEAEDACFRTAGGDGRDRDAGLSDGDQKLVQQLASWREARARAARPARIKDAGLRVFGRAVGNGTAAWGLYVGCVALTAAFPPLAITVAVVGGLGLWWSGASLLSAVKSLRRACSGESPQALASNPVANAWYRGLVEDGSGSHATRQGRAQARVEAAKAAARLGNAWSGITLGLSCVSAAQAAALLMRVVRTAASSAASVTGWKLERFATTAGRVPDQPGAWDPIDEALRTYRQSLLVRDRSQLPSGVATVPVALQRELLRWNFDPADLENFFSPTFGAWSEADQLRPRRDEALKVLGELTDSSGVAGSLRAAAWTAADAYRTAA